mgnify:CR=1 FL=1
MSTEELQARIRAGEPLHQIEEELDLIDNQPSTEPSSLMDELEELLMGGEE